MSNRCFRCMKLVLALLMPTVSSILDVQSVWAQGTRTSAPEAVRQIIRQAGESPPAWMADVPLNVPGTLNLEWERVAEGWQPNRNLDSHLFAVVMRDTTGLRRGARLLHRVLEVNAGDAEKLRRTQDALAGVYLALGEYAHAAYYFHQTGSRTVEQACGLAYSYARLGDTDAAAAILKQIPSDTTRTALLVKTWADIGHLDTALEVAAKRAQTPALRDAAFLAAGNALVRAGQFDRAMQFFDSTVKLNVGGRDLNRIINRARESLDTLRGGVPVELAHLPDGTFQGSAKGYRGPLIVKVTLKEGRIEVVRVTDHREDRTVGAETSVPARIVEQQGIAGVDAVTGATMTTEAILNATIRALKSAADR